MKHIKISDVTVSDNRQRKKFSADDISDLADSILSKGLFHPIILQNDNSTLIAGERRLRAFKLIWNGNKGIPMCNDKPIPADHIPYLILSELSPIEIREAELEENICRVDISWQERSAAIAELHELRLEQNPEQTYKQTGLEIFQTEREDIGADVHQAITLQKHMDDPKVRGAKSIREAVKIVKKKQNLKLHGIMADIMDETSLNKITQGNWNDVLLDQTLDKYDCVVCDPPYGVGADKFHEQATTTHEYSDAWELASDMFSVMNLRVLYDALASQAHLYIFAPTKLYMHIVRNIDITRELHDCKWEIWPRPLIWYKGSSGMLPEPDFGPRNTYETIMYINKGKKKLIHQGLPDCITKFPHESDRLHGAQKPVDLYENLLRRSCSPGDYVLDFCCGTGTIFLAANRLSLVAHGIEINEEFYKLSKSNLNKKDR